MKTHEFGTKAKFIRSLPSTMPAKQVVAEGAKRGLRLSEGHIYNLRSRAKMDEKIETLAPSLPTEKPEDALQASSEAALRRAIGQLGFLRVHQILAEMLAKFS